MADLLIQLCHSLGLILSIGINVNGMACLQVLSVYALYVVGISSCIGLSREVYQPACKLLCICKQAVCLTLPRFVARRGHVCLADPLHNISGCSNRSGQHQQLVDFKTHNRD